MSMTNNTLFNTSIEAGLRSLIILNSIYPDLIDLDRLLIYDYLILHTNDVDNHYKSLHPSIPHRSGELLVKRKLLQDGIELMESRGLLSKHFLNEGIYYSANKLTDPFLNYFESEYSIILKRYAEFIKNKFHHLSFSDLKNYITRNLDVWGGEFEYESVLRGEMDWGE